MKFLPLLFVLAACGRGHSHPEHTSPVPDAFVELYEETLAQLKASSDPATGWPSATNCDGTLWAGLARSGGSDANLALAEYSPGEIHRRPSSTGPCWAGKDVGSRSTVSRDMLVGYVWGLWTQSDLGGLQRLADFGAANNWVMGQPASQGEVELGDNLKGVLCRAIRVLSLGTDSRPCAEKPSTYLPVFEDYEKHIQVLAIVLEGDVDPTFQLVDVDDNGKNRLEASAADYPSDGLFQTAKAIYDGNFDPALELLSDPSYACPTYVRGADNYCLVHKAFAMWLLLRHKGVDA